MPRKETFHFRYVFLKKMAFVVMVLASWLSLSLLLRPATAQHVDNQPPMLAVPKDQVGKANTEIKFTVVARDFDSFAPISITADGLPAGAEFEITAISNNSTLGTFTWTPASTDAGRSFNITFTASDGELSDTKQVTVSVVGAEP